MNKLDDQYVLPSVDNNCHRRLNCSRNYTASPHQIVDSKEWTDWEVPYWIIKLVKNMLRLSLLDTKDETLTDY